MSADQIPADLEWYYLLRISVSDGLLYYVEARQKPGEEGVQVFDPALALMDRNYAFSVDESLGGILVTRVLRGRVSTSQQMRYITVEHEPCKNPYDPRIEPHTLIAGGLASDLASGLMVEVLKPVHERPLVYKVRVSWDRKRALGFLPPAVKKPLYNKFTAYGPYNLYLRSTSIDDEAWECPDIWVEREPFKGSPGDPDWDPEGHDWDYGWDRTEGRPCFNGDRPVQGRKHRIWARVWRDECPMDAPGVRDGAVRGVVVRLFDLVTPFTGIPTPIGQATCDVKIGGYTDVCFHDPGKGRVWMPSSPNTAWLVVDVNNDRTAEERDSSDNIGRLVAFDYECGCTVAGSPGEEKVPSPVYLQVPVYNPHADRENTIWLGVEVDHGPNKGKADDSVFEISWDTSMQLGPGAKKDIQLTVKPRGDRSWNSIVAEPTRIRVLQYMLYNGSLPSDPKSVPRVPIRGLTYWISLKQAVNLSLEASVEKSGPYSISLEGRVTSATGKKEKCFIDVTGTDGMIVSTKMVDVGTDGTFGTVFGDLIPGTHKATACIVFSKKAAQAWSEPVELVIGDSGELTP
jgi:hypothetical protein